MKDFETLKNSIVYYGNSYSLIYPCLERVEKKLKALDIIHDKLVDMYKLQYCLDKEWDSSDAIKYYNEHFDQAYQLTKEDYELFKEVF